MRTPQEEDRLDEIEQGLILTAKHAEEQISTKKRDAHLKDLIKGFFEERKEFMMANRYKVGQVTFYPTSKACLKGKPKDTEL